MMKKYKFFGLFIVYLLFFVCLGMLFFHPVQCPYERNVSKINITETKISKNSYAWAIEEKKINYDDPFHLARVSGWIAKPDGKYYVPVSAYLILYSESEDIAYKVRLYEEKRTDIPGLNQSVPNSELLFVGFFAQFPTKNIQKEKYRIGFLLDENNIDCIVWSDSVFSVI